MKFPRSPESEIRQGYMNMALAIQKVTEEIILKLAQTAKEKTVSDYLVMAEGALRAAYIGWHTWLGNELKINSFPDAVKGCLLGPEFSEKDIRRMAGKFGAVSSHYEDFHELTALVARQVSGGKVVGWFQGRMEFGPRALGNRSILGDARNPAMQKRMNLKIAGIPCPKITMISIYMTDCIISVLISPLSRTLTIRHGFKVPTKIQTRDTGLWLMNLKGRPDSV